jgi:hypothetical protein
VLSTSLNKAAGNKVASDRWSIVRRSRQRLSTALLIRGGGSAMSAHTETVKMADDSAFGASHTSFYTSAVAKDSYQTMDEILNTKLADEGVRTVVKEMLDACVKITEALRVNLVTVADAQNSVFGDVQLGVDVIADDLMWEACKSSKVVREGASEEAPELRSLNENGRFTVCWLRPSPFCVQPCLKLSCSLDDRIWRS